MKAWKKLAGLALALALMVCLGVSAMAETLPFSEGVAADLTTAITSTSFTVTRSVTATNGLVAADAYTYTISGAGVTFSETQPSVSGVTIERTSDTVLTVTFDAAQAGNVADAATVNLNIGTFSYSASPQTATITQSHGGDTSVAYTVSVYTKRNGDVYGVTLQNDSNTKQPGYVVTTPVSLVSAGGSVVLTKQVEGNNANMDEAFPFTVTVTIPDAIYNTHNLSNWTFGAELSSGTATSTDITTSTLTHDADHKSMTYHVSLKDDGTLTLTDLPKDTTVTVNEAFTEDEGYTIAPVLGGTYNSTGSSVADNPSYTSNTSVLVVSAGGNGTITYTNTRAVTSPTGVVLRYAPYLAMLCAGFTTVAIAPRRKEEE